MIENRVEEGLNQIFIEIEKGRRARDSRHISHLIYWLGKAELRLSEKQSFPEALRIKDSLIGTTSDPYVLYHALLGLSRLYNEVGDLSEATRLGKGALTAAQSAGEREFLATASYYLGEYSLRSGDFSRFEEYTRASLRHIRNHPGQFFPISPKTYNYMGALMYLTAKPDSAQLYFENALSATRLMKPDGENRLYFPAAIKANMVLLYQSQNQFDRALELARECVVLNSRFLQEEENHPLRFRSLRNQSLAYRNLASLYEQIGNYSNTLFIAEKAYEHARKNFDPGVLEYFSAVTLYSEAKVANRDFEEALDIQHEARASLEAMSEVNPLLWANYSSINASAYFGLGQFDQARRYYEQAQEYFDRAQSDPLSSDRIFASINLALSYTELGAKDKSFEVLETTYTALQGLEQPNSRWVNAVTTALARTAIAFSDYDRATEYTDSFLERNKNDLSAAVQAYLPEIYLYKAKGQYQMREGQDPEPLSRIDSLLSKALQVLEDRIILYSSGDTSHELIREHLNVFDFAKQIKLERYRASGDLRFVQELLQIHESALYHRIRTRLNSEKYAMDFNLPREIMDRESTLKSTWDPSSGSVEDFVSYKQEWESFLDSIRTRFPRYFNLRYATITADLEGIQSELDKETAVIRYLFIGEELYAYLIDSGHVEWVSLEARDIEPDIERVSDLRFDAEDISKSLNRLYRQLWQPLQPLIRGKRVIILPDGPLFNLSFELLSPEPFDDFRELAETCLLSRYELSYHYSLQLLKEGRAPRDYKRDFVAFVPEFDREMKEAYARSIADPSLLDEAYIKLLPQPFTMELARQVTKKFQGQLINGQEATKSIFSSQAGGSRIIHIGSHAESNNVNPQLSRLIFAKDMNDSSLLEDNSLRAFEIYNLNLDSELTALTACETGKPAYQPGEGMVSLAHAFNYAGSHSLVTGLWPIDEQASAAILNTFYDALGQGHSKDRALRLAKLDYLKNASGRTVHPQYWAGLIVMGEAAPVPLNRGKGFWWLLTALVPLSAGLYWLYLKRKASR